MILFGSIRCADEPVNTDHDGIFDDKDQCIDVPGIPPKGCPQEITAIRFYIEKSASMGGYYAGGAYATVVVSDLVNKIDKEIRPGSISLISDTLEILNGDVTAFSDFIAKEKFTDSRV